MILLPFCDRLAHRLATNKSYLFDRNAAHQTDAAPRAKRSSKLRITNWYQSELAHSTFAAN